MAENRSNASTEEEEIGIPRAALNKMIKEILPNTRIANDARELISNCCTEFIHLIASEANEICNKQNRKTISPEHILAAMDRLGFASYKQEAEAVLVEAKEVAAKKRRASTRLENLGIPEEELLRQQQELFAKARLEQEALDQQQWFITQQQVAAAAAAAQQAGLQSQSHDQHEYD